MGDWDDLNLGTGEIPSMWLVEDEPASYKKTFVRKFQNPRFIFLNFDDALFYLRGATYVSSFLSATMYRYPLYTEMNLGLNYHSIDAQRRERIVRRYKGKYTGLKDGVNNLFTILAEDDKNSDDEYDYLIFDKQIDNGDRKYIYSMYEKRGIENLKPSFFSADDFFYSNYNSYDLFKYKELEFRKVENALYEKIESMRWATEEVKQRAHSSNITWIQSYDELTIEEKEFIEKYDKYIISYVVSGRYKVFHFDTEAIADLIYEEVRGCKVPSYIRKWEEFKLYVLESYKTR